MIQHEQQELEVHGKSFETAYLPGNGLSVVKTER